MLPGIWRLRLPLPWPGVPHGNLWAVRSGDGVVLFDTGIHEPETDDHPSSRSELELAMSQAGLRLSDVKLLVCTHAHSDHYGQAAPILEAAGCELWMHPDHEHQTRAAADPDAAIRRRIEVGLASGVPEAPLRTHFEQRRKMGPGVAAVVEPDRPLVPGVQVETDLGAWDVHYTPGHAPSHVCLHQPERGLLISGDHLLGRVFLFYDFGFSPDPVAEYLASLDLVEGLPVSLCLPGHGRPFRHVREQINATRGEVLRQRESFERRLPEEPKTPFELIPDSVPAEFTPWALTQTLAYLNHLERRGLAVREEGEDGKTRWARPAGLSGDEHT